MALADAERCLRYRKSDVCRGRSGQFSRNLERALSAPKTTAAIIAKLNSAANEGLKSEEIRSVSEHEPHAGRRQSAAMGQFVRSETARWSDVTPAPASSRNNCGPRSRRPALPPPKQPRSGCSYTAFAKLERRAASMLTTRHHGERRR